MVDQEAHSDIASEQPQGVPQEPAPSGNPPDSTSADAGGTNIMALRKIQNIKVSVQAVLGTISLSVSQLANLKKGEFLQLETKVGDPIDIHANGQLIARGEIVVVEGESSKFGITLTEIMDANIN